MDFNFFTSVYSIYNMQVIGLRNLCMPASVYLTVSLIALVLLISTNYGNQKLTCLGNFSCNADVVHIVIIKVLYIVFWTWVLNIICKTGAEMLAWFLVVIPVVLYLLMTWYL